jgi:hypothetical protein
MDNLGELIPLLIPIFVLQIALLVIALRDLLGREQTRGSRLAWALIIIFVNILGPMAYLLFGREE